MRRRNRWRWLTVWALSLAVAGCNGGGVVADGGGGGIGGTGVVAARGPITGFGSIWVNGIHFDISEAVVKVEGEDATAASLRLGMVVAVSGTRGADGSVSAERVEYAASLEGAIESLGVDGFRVLGQVVVVTDQTQVDGAPLQAGQVVEVSGLVDVDGTIHATYVENKADAWAPGDEIELKGVARNVDPTAETFEIHGLIVSHPGIQGPMEEDFVAVKSTRGVENGALVALAVEIEGRGALAYDNDVDADLEGFITAVESGARFTLDRTPVDASAARFENGTPADLVENARVEVEGTFRGGVLVAAKVEFDGEGD
jgi:hypothetical protein